MALTATAPFVVADPTDHRHPWQVLAGGEQTGGAVMFGDSVMPPRTAGPSRHVHQNEDEALFILSGVLTVEVGDQRHEVATGMLMLLPRGVPHTFANLSDEPVRGLGIVTPAGLEKMFAEQADYLERLTGPPDHEALMEICARYGVTPVDGPSLI
jgi:mannose-6-phosphate isomerase-like protein (cupin superfamily)